MAYPANPRPRTVPCRRQLLDLLLTIQAPTRRIAVWEIPRAVWSALKADPELRSNWTEEGIRTRLLFDVPVRLTETGRARIIIEIQ